MSYSRKWPISSVGRNELQGYDFDLGHAKFRLPNPFDKTYIPNWLRISALIRNILR